MKKLNIIFPYAMMIILICLWVTGMFYVKEVIDFMISKKPLVKLIFSGGVVFIGLYMIVLFIKMAHKDLKELEDEN